MKTKIQVLCRDSRKPIRCWAKTAIVESARLISPNGYHHNVTNITDFVRRNPDLFHADAILDVNAGKGRDSVGFQSHATKGLSKVVSGHRLSWRGWRLA